MLNDISETIHYAATKKYQPGGVVVRDRTTFTGKECPETATLQVESKLFNGRLEVLDLWSPTTYVPFARQLLKQEGVAAKAGARSFSGPELLRRLASPTLKILVETDSKLSKELGESPADPELHEQAALLMATLALKEECGDASHPDILLARACSHLVVAYALADKQSTDCGRIAAAIVHALAGNQKAENQYLGQVAAGEPAEAWKRVLQVRPSVAYTGRFRPHGNVTPLQQGILEATLLERWEYFRAKRTASLFTLDGESGQPRLLKNPEEGLSSDWYMIALTKVGTIGEKRLALSLPTRLLAEFAYVQGEGEAFRELSKQIAEAVRQGAGESLMVPTGESVPRLLKLMNTKPERLVTREGVRILSPGHWADFYQRHYLYSLDSAHTTLRRGLGMPDEARDFREKTRKASSQLRLLPFHLWDAEPNNDNLPGLFPACQAVLVSDPHLVPPAIFGRVFSPTLYGKKGLPGSGLAFNVWFAHMCPPGVVSPFYGMFIKASQSIEFQRKALQLSPDNRRAGDDLLRAEFGNQKSIAPISSVKEVYGPRLAYDDALLAWVAETYYEEDLVEFEKAMTLAASINPRHYERMGLLTMATNPAKGLQQLQECYDVLDDPVTQSSFSIVLVKKLLDEKRLTEAKKMAVSAGEVYSAAGLKALAYFQERTGDKRGAYRTYKALAERYQGHDAPLKGFCYRNKSADIPKTDAEAAEAYIRRAFPQGITMYSPQAGLPTTGMRVTKSTMLSRVWGIEAGDVVVAYDGIAVQSLPQVTVMQNWKPDPDMEVTVRRDTASKTIKVVLTDRKFGTGLRPVGNAP